MTRVLALLSLLAGAIATGCAASGPLVERPAASAREAHLPASPARIVSVPPRPPTDCAPEVEAYLTRLETSKQYPVVAPASGGVVGWLSAQVYVWFPKIDGTMTTGGESVDFKDDLGMEEGEEGIMPQVQVSLGSMGLKFGAYFLEFHGEGTITRSFTFGGATFLVNEDVTTDVKIDAYRLLSNIPIGKSDFFALYLQGGLTYFHLEGTITGSTSGTGSGSADVPLPVAGVLAQFKVWRFIFEVDASGFSLDIGDMGASLFDVQATAGITVLKVVSVRAGYRYVKIDAHADDFALDGTISGFFVGVGFQF